MNLMGLYKSKNMCFGSQENQQNSCQAEMWGYPQQDLWLELQDIY